MLGTLELHVLLAVLRGAGKAYGVSIAEELEVRTGKHHSMGAIYTTLDRLQTKKMVASRQGEATAERGGRAKLYFEITAGGRAAVDSSLNATANLSRGLKIREAKL
jgi:PadR family transcriptional regulator, regulatory protein PadR